MEKKSEAGEFLNKHVEIENQVSCAECGEEISSFVKKSYPAYCKKCTPIKNIKETWKPLGSGSVSKIFILN